MRGRGVGVHLWGGTSDGLRPFWRDDDRWRGSELVGVSTWRVGWWRGNNSGCQEVEHCLGLIVVSPRPCVHWRTTAADRKHAAECVG